MTRGSRWGVAGLALLVVVSTSGCAVDSYERMPVGSKDCFLCHAEDYEAVTDPIHVGVNPTTCWKCHETGSFRPANEGTHPDDDFRITSGHHSIIRCGECHDATRGRRANGANTSCTGCHLGVHDRAAMDSLHTGRGVASYPLGATEPNFCLSCHIDGNAPGTPHPEEAFSITEGNHAGLTCLECHDTVRGSSGDGANTGCTLCHLDAHPRSETDVFHEGLANYPTGDAPPNVCLRCHAHGNADTHGHPERRFPIASGPHDGWNCRDCHDESASPRNSRENTDCIGCHIGQHAHAADQTAHSYGSTRDRFRELQSTGSHHFCLTCHPHGRAE